MSAAIGQEIPRAQGPQRAGARCLVSPIGRRSVELIAGSIEGIRDHIDEDRTRRGHECRAGTPHPERAGCGTRSRGIVRCRELRHTIGGPGVERRRLHGRRDRAGAPQRAPLTGGTDPACDDQLPREVDHASAGLDASSTPGEGAGVVLPDERRASSCLIEIVPRGRVPHVRDRRAAAEGATPPRRAGARMAGSGPWRRRPTRLDHSSIARIGVPARS